MQYFEQWHNELDIELLLFSRKGEIVGKQQILFITVKNHQPERFISSMNIIFPFKISFDCELDLEAAPGNRLGVSIDFHSRHMMDKFIKNFS